MDVLALIDKLDDLVHNARAVPLTDQVRIDREAVYELLDQMRSTIPEEIKQARWIVKERQEMLAEAKREADRIVEEARDKAERQASQQEVVKLAEKQANELLDDARMREREVRLGAEDYADEVLGTLEVNLEKFTAAVRRGRERLQGTKRHVVVGRQYAMDVAVRAQHLSHRAPANGALVISSAARHHLDARIGLGGIQKAARPWRAGR